MSKKPKLVFLVGGPEIHPAEPQAKKVVGWLGDEFATVFYDGIDTFENLQDCDLLILMGWHFFGNPGEYGVEYRPMQENHVNALEDYVGSGRPLLVHHASICNYFESPRYHELIGFKWIIGETNHPPIDDREVKILPTGHPIVAGLDDFTIYDELYYNVLISPELDPTVHAVAPYEDKEYPMVFTVEGGRIPGAGRLVYLANGHDMKTYECKTLEPLWGNAVNWLLDRT